MRTAMQSQNLKVTTYTSFFRHCKSKTVGWVARLLDPEAVFPKENELVEVLFYCVMREASRMGQPVNHTLHMLCTDIQSSILLG